MKRLLAIALLTSLFTASCAGHGNQVVPPTQSTQQSATAPDAGTPQATQQGEALPQSVTPSWTQPFGVARGDAYAAFARISSPLTVLLGPIAPVNGGCSTASGQVSNSVASISASGLIASGTALDTWSSTRSSGSVTVRATSTVQNVNLLGGVITANVIAAVANSNATTAGGTSNGNGSTFASLTVNGHAIAVTPAPNTTINLPNIGFVVLNEQSIMNGTFTTANVNMIHVHITIASVAGLKVGTELIVAHARSSFTQLVSPTLVAASSYALFAKGFAGNINATSGPWAPAGISCVPGTANDRLLSASTPVGNLGTMQDSATGEVDIGGGSAQGDADVANANLLNGIVTFDAVHSTAKVQLSSGTFTRSGSTTLVNAKVLGLPLNATPGPNTHVDILGLGFVILNEQSGTTGTSSADQSVNGLHIFVTTVNLLGLPIGANVIVAHAHARVLTL